MFILQVCTEYVITAAVMDYLSPTSLTSYSGTHTYARLGFPLARGLVLSPQVHENLNPHVTLMLPFNRDGTDTAIAPTMPMELNQITHGHGMGTATMLDGPLDLRASSSLVSHFLSVVIPCSQNYFCSSWNGVYRRDMLMRAVPNASS